MLGIGPGMYLVHSKSINVSPGFFQNQVAVVRDSDRTRKVQVHDAPGLISHKGESGSDHFREAAGSEMV